MNPYYMNPKERTPADLYLIEHYAEETLDQHSESSLDVMRNMAEIALTIRPFVDQFNTLKRRLVNAFKRLGYDPSESEDWNALENEPEYATVMSLVELAQVQGKKMVISFVDKEEDS